MASSFEIYQRLGIQALEAMMRTNAIPQKIDYFFPYSSNLTEREASKETGWQFKFLAGLVTRGALTNNKSYFAVKNRYFIELLLKEARLKFAGDRRFMGMISEATGVPIPILPAPEPSKPATPEPPKPAAPEVQKSIPKPKSDASPPQEFTIGEGAIKYKETRAEAKARAASEEVPVESPVEPESKNMDLSEVVLLLRNLTENFEQHDQVQTKLIENIIFVRDRNEKLHERVKGLSERISNLEQQLNVPRPAESVDVEVHSPDLEILTSSVNSMSKIVESEKDEVQQAMQSEEASKLAEVRATLNRISNEFSALQQLTLESLSESPS